MNNDIDNTDIDTPVVLRTTHRLVPVILDAHEWQPTTIGNGAQVVGMVIWRTEQCPHCGARYVWDQDIITGATHYSFYAGSVDLTNCPGAEALKQLAVYVLGMLRDRAITYPMPEVAYEAQRLGFMIRTFDDA